MRRERAARTRPQPICRIFSRTLIKGIAQYARRARAVGVADKHTDDFIFNGLFTTLTNVNFPGVDVTAQFFDSQMGFVFPACAQ
ncbi:MAG: hypothetical protein ACYCY2_04045 [Acidithiobacillus ferriphilus]